MRFTVSINNGIPNMGKSLNIFQKHGYDVSKLIKVEQKKP